MDFYGELAFSYDPAQTGNDDLSISIIGGDRINLWLFTINISVSITITVDASFLSSSEYQPLPPQQVTAPINPVTAEDNTNPDSWSYQAQMFGGNNFGGALSNSTANYQAVSDAANASTINTTNDAFDSLWNAGYFTSNWSANQDQGYPSPSTIDSIGTNSWPGAYMVPNTEYGASFSVVPVNGSNTLGQSADTSATYTELEVTAHLPSSVLMDIMQATLTPESMYFPDQIPPSNNPNGYWFPAYGSCSSGTTVTYTVKIPQVPNSAPGNWAWVMMDANWRLFGSTLRETAQLYTNWQDEPAANQWYDWESTVGDAYNVGGNILQIPLPLQADQMANPTTPVGCGYEDFATQTSLYDFVTANNIAWSSLPVPPLTGDPYTSAASGPLQPGWGQGWQPYNLVGTQYGYGKALNVWDNGSNASIPECTLSSDAAPVYNPVELSVPNGSVTQVWSDPSNNWVSIQGGNYLQVNSSGNSANPYSLALYNSAGSELRWNGSSWATEPSGGWTSGYQPFSAQGQLYAGASDLGVLYISSQNHATFLAFTGANPLMTAYQGGNPTPSYTYTPDSDFNTCVGTFMFSGNAIYQQP